MLLSKLAVSDFKFPYLQTTALSEDLYFDLPLLQNRFTPAVVWGVGIFTWTGFLLLLGM